MLFVLLNSFITVIVVIAGWNVVQSRVAQYYASFLLLSGIMNGVFAALDQRIAVRYHIGPMDLGDSTAYLRHHLALAGRSDQLFADDAIVRLHRQSNGIPRALTNAAVAALIAAAADGKEIVDDACARKAVAELTRD